MSARTRSSKPRPRIGLGITLCILVGCSLLALSARAQATQKTPTELDEAIARVSSGDASNPGDVVVIANAGAVQSIPALEEQFRRSPDVNTKVSIASGLVKLRDRDDTYWNFLLEQATLAVDSNIPDVTFSESQGKMTTLGPELQAWAAAHNVSVNTAGIHAYYDFPGKVLQLATTGDPRGIPLLRRALQSRNYLIVLSAAKGLAQVQDKESIPLIIAEAQRAPAEYRSLIAESLVYFDDAQAQSAVDNYLSKQIATANRQERARGRGVFGW